VVSLVEPTKMAGDLRREERMRDIRKYEALRFADSLMTPAVG
jgi:hypothetical protein